MADTSKQDEDPAAAAAAAELQAEIMALYTELNEEDSDGLNFVGATSQAIAFERNVESEREDRLFNDHLAKHFIGTKGEKCSRMVNKHLGLSYGIENVHIGYTAARTKLINDKVDQWIARLHGKEKMQIVNLGAGVDTRAFWMESLQSIESYTEVDTESVNEFKNKKYAELDASPLCPRRVVSMDFSKESPKDLPNHGYDPNVPTCWILEGLVMYLSKDVNKSILEEISEISAKGSFLVLNFIEGLDYMEPLLKEKGWSNEIVLKYGEKDFNYGRFPEGNAPVSLAFAFFDLV